MTPLPDPRIIKFRFWNGKEMLSELTLADIVSECSYLPGECFGDLVPLQFTGIKDRLGKDIFEGDLLRGYTSNEKSDDLMTVEWCMLGAGDDADMDSYGFHFNLYWYEWEIEGNIYENKNLIKES